MCRLCLPHTTLEQHFKYFKESGFTGPDIVRLVEKSHTPSRSRHIHSDGYTFHIVDEAPTTTIDGTYREVPKELKGSNNVS
jgi:hypothetical protein